MIFFILVSVLFSINFKYEVGDWFTLSNPKSINSITSTNNEIIFCSENGVFKYNMLTSSFNFDEEYLREFDNQKSIIVFDDYDEELFPGVVKACDYLSSLKMHSKKEFITIQNKRKLLIFSFGTFD